MNVKPFTGQFGELVVRTSQLVADDWDGLRREAASTEEARAQVALISDAIRATLEGRPGLPPGCAPSPLGRRIVDLMRRQLLEILTDEGSLKKPDDFLKLFGALETVGKLLEPSWEQRLSDRLSGPEALELVVEVAHDLRSPLTSILFLAETLKRGRSGPVTPLQERQLGLIYSAAFGLSSVASDVIELVRGGDRLLATEVVPFSVQETIESVCDIVQPIAEEKNLNVQVEVGALGLRMGQPVALSRVLLNLTTNALKFTDQGSVAIRALPSNGAAIEFAIQDTGRGIPPEAMAMLFEPFRRRSRPGDYAFSGSGLGLSICRKLVEAMGGELMVRTDSGRGTQFLFSVELPPHNEETSSTEAV